MTLNKAILYTAKGLSIFSLFIIGMFLAGEFFSDQASSFTSTKEIIMFSFFPMGLCIGLILSWKNSLIGGLIATISILAFHFIEKSMGFHIWIDGLAFPGVLFLLNGIIKRVK